MSNFRGQCVVITGASSGLGREAAVQFAERGANVVLAARRLDALDETARLCRERRAGALVVRTDVTQEAEVLALARAAVAQFGRIDVWVNNAGVTLFALLDDAPFHEHRRVIETNVFGSMLGARAVVPIFKSQQHGVLINVGSTLSKIGQPFVPSYAISKFAIHGLSEVLRTQLADWPNIHVCTTHSTSKLGRTRSRRRPAPNPAPRRLGWFSRTQDTPGAGRSHAVDRARSRMRCSRVYVRTAVRS